MGALGVVALMAAGIATADAASRAFHGGTNREFTETQREAIAQARELKAAGDTAGARQVLEDANILRAAHAERRVPTEEQKAKMTAVTAAIENSDYAAFQVAVDGTKLEGKIDTEAEFDLLVEAHELRAAGDKAAARKIMGELGFNSGLRHNAR